MSSRRLYRKKIVVLFSAIISVFLAELILFIILGPVKSAQVKYNEQYRWAYTDIYDNFYEADEIGISRTIRPRALKEEFFEEKGRITKRVFIIGESIAYLFNKEKLLNTLTKQAPKYIWEIINSGMGGYDSYRVKLVLERILKFKPDIILMLLGHNEGLHNPVYIKEPKSALFNKSRIANLIYRIFNPIKKIDRKKIHKKFIKNIDEISKICEERGILLITYTMPSNHNMPRTSPPPYHKKDFFEAWWLQEKFPADSLKKFYQLYETEKNMKYHWYIAKSYKLLGKNEEYLNHISYNPIPYHKKRNNALKETASDYSSTKNIDLEKDLRPFIKRYGYFSFFFDHVHLWDEIYAYIGFLTANMILRNLEIEKKFSESTFDIPKMINKTKTNIMKKDFMKRFLEIQLFYAPDKDVEIHKEMIKIFLENGKKYVKKVVNDKKYVSNAEGDKKKISEVFSTIGQAFSEKGYFNDAQIYFDIAADNEEHNTILNLFSGLFYYKTGNKNKSENFMKRLKSIDRRFDWISYEYLVKLNNAKKEINK